MRRNHDESEHARTAKPSKVSETEQFALIIEEAHASQRRVIEENAPIVRRTEVRAHMRRVPGEPLPTGEERKKAALDAHDLNAHKRAAKEWVREELRKLYASRCNDRIRFPVPFVNADDAKRLLDNWPQRPRELDAIEGHWRGTIFKKGFEHTGGRRPTVRDELKGTELPDWRPIAVSESEAAA